jgi:hypothetical protein
MGLSIFKCKNFSSLRGSVNGRTTGGITEAYVPPKIYYLLPGCGSQKRIVCILQNAGATVV